MTKDDLIRAVFTRLISEASQERSAGIVIIKKDSDYPLFLALLKPNDKYDITKGIIEPGESDLDCALREAWEESGIILREENFKWGKISKSYGHGIAFIAETDDSPVITPNPESGILEHIEAKWVTFDEMIKNVSEFLIPAINWAYNVKMDNTHVNI